MAKAHRYGVGPWPNAAFWLLGVAFSVPNNTEAADYYVSQEGAGLSDGSSVENAWPGWRKIEWGSLAGGDVLYVLGTLRGEFAFAVGASGTSESERFTLRGYDETSALLDGLEYGDGGWTDPDVFQAFSRSAAGSFNELRQWTTDPFDFKVLNKRIAPPDSSWKAGDWFYDFNSSRQLYYRPTDDLLAGKTLTKMSSTSTTLAIAGQDYVTIENLRIVHGIRVGEGKPAHYLWVHNNTITGHGYQTGIRVNVSGNTLGSNNGRISYNTISNAGDGIYGINQNYDETHDNHRWRIDHNEIFDISGTKDSHCIGWQGGNSNLIENNDLHGCRSGVTFWIMPSRLYFKDGSRDFVVGEVLTTDAGAATAIVTRGGKTVVARVEGGSFSTNDAIGYVNVRKLRGEWNADDVITSGTDAATPWTATGETTRQTSRNNIVRFNTVHEMLEGNGRGIEYSGDHSENELNSGNLVYGNVVWNCKGICLRSKTGPPQDGDAWRFFNNTLVGCGTGFASQVSNYVQDTTPNLWLRNNLILYPRENGAHLTLHAFGGPAPVVIDHNLYYPDTQGQTGTFAWLGVKQTDFAAWQTSASLGQGSIIAEPALVEDTTFNEVTDFAPLWNSPAIDAGIETGQTALGDILGNPVYGAPDLGAIEYQPPYQMGIDPIYVDADPRIYADGRFRNRAAPGSTVAELTVQPIDGYQPADRRHFLDIEILQWSATSEVEAATNGDQVRRWRATFGPGFVAGGEMLYTLGGLGQEKCYQVATTKDAGNPTQGPTLATDKSGSASFAVEGDHTSPTDFLVTAAECETPPQPGPGAAGEGSDLESVGAAGCACGEQRGGSTWSFLGLGAVAVLRRRRKRG